MNLLHIVFRSTTWLGMAGLLAACNPEVVNVRVTSQFAGSASPSKFVFATSSLAGTPYAMGFAIDPLSGDLSPVPGLPTAATGAGSNLVNLGVTPAGTYLFAADSDNPAHILSFPIAADGSLGTPAVLTVTPSVGASQAPLLVDPTGRFLYMLAFSTTNHIYGFRIENNGTLTPVGTFAAAINVPPGGFAMHPSGQYLFVATSARVDMYSANTVGPGADGVVAYAGVFAAASSGNVNAIAMDPNGQYLAVGTASTNDMELMAIETSSPDLNQAGVPQTACFSGDAIPMFDPNGKYIYAGCTTDGSAYSLLLDRTTPALGANVSSLSMGSVNTPQIFAITRDGKYVYDSFGSFDGYAMDFTTGTGTKTPGSPYPGVPTYPIQAPILTY